jgi:hypothetical protein
LVHGETHIDMETLREPDEDVPIPKTIMAPGEESDTTLPLMDLDSIREIIRQSGCRGEHDQSDLITHNGSQCVHDDPDCERIRAHLGSTGQHHPESARIVFNTYYFDLETNTISTKVSSPEIEGYAEIISPMCHKVGSTVYISVSQNRYIIRDERTEDSAEARVVERLPLPGIAGAFESKDSGEPDEGDCEPESGEGDDGDCEPNDESGESEPDDGDDGDDGDKYKYCDTHRHTITIDVDEPFGATLESVHGYNCGAKVVKVDGLSKFCVGDIILSVDGQNVETKSFTKVLCDMKLARGHKFDVLVFRPNSIGPSDVAS